MKTKLHPSILNLILAAAIAVAAPGAKAESLSELLEKGIYAEETKGDLDAAISIYQQLVHDGQNARSLAAQAQLRLGQCLLKKKRDAEAVAAFEKLIHDFPGEKELIAKARTHLPDAITLGPVPWVDGERLQMTLSLPAGLEVGAMELRADLVEADGWKVWRVGRRMSGGGQMLSSVDVEPENFHPLTSYWKHTLLDEVTATFSADGVEMRKAGAEPSVVRPEKTVYDNEEFMHMMRRLPLAVGYKTTIPTITTLGGGAVLPVGLEVTGKETVEVPAGKFDCVKVPLNIGQTFWISDDAHRYLVKFEAGGAIAKLTTITQRKAGASVPFRDDALGVSFTAPADWVIQRQSGERKGRTSIHLLDPAADADHAMLRLTAADTLSAPVRQSPRAWADEDLREGAKEAQDLKVRADSWKNHNLSGRVAVSCIADYIEGGKPMAMFALYALGPKTCEHFYLAAKADRLDALRPAFDGIIASYRTKK